ncbi:MAG: ABC transporter permease, partial [Gemmatimonadota bacterium]
MSHDLTQDERRAVDRYRRLWRAYPANFRQRFEDDAMHVFVSRYREEGARGSRATMLWFWIRSSGTVLLHGAAERISGARVDVGSWRSDVTEVLRAGRRSLRRQVAAVLCVALGLAATSAVMTLVSSTLLQPLPFPDADRLVRVWGIEESVELAGRGQLSYPDLRDLEATMTTLQPLVAAGRSRQMFLTDGGARRVEGEAVTEGYFELLGIEPHLGRTFGPDDHRPGSNPTLLLSFGTWLRVYGGDPGVLGTTLRTAGRDFTIVGVLPSDFLGTIEADFPDLEFWIPLEHQLTAERRENRGAEFIWTIGRLQQGGGLSDVRREVRELSDRLEGEGVVNPGEGYWAEPFGENWRGELRSRNLLLLGAALLLLLVAATNVAGLQLARAVERRRESAVRAALGASPTRLLRLSVLETVLTTGLGGVLGLALAPMVLRSFLRIAPEAVPGYIDVVPDAASLLVSFLVLAGTALMSAVAPGLLQARTPPGQALVSGGRSATQGRSARKLSRGLVVGEIAVTTVLLTSAVLLVQSYRAMGQADVGFRSDGILKAAVFVDSQDIPESAALPAFYRSLRERLGRVPGIEAVGLASPTVPPGFSGEGRVRFDGMPDVSRETGLLAYTHLVDEHMMAVLEIPILAGRSVEAMDGAEGGNVVVISESLAGVMGGVDTAVGRQIELFDAVFDVVGVAGDVMYLGAAVPRPRDIDVYLPIAAD